MIIKPQKTAAIALAIILTANLSILFTPAPKTLAQSPTQTILKIDPALLKQTTLAPAIDPKLLNTLTPAVTTPPVNTTVTPAATQITTGTVGSPPIDTTVAPADTTTTATPCDPRKDPNCTTGTVGTPPAGTTTSSDTPTTNANSTTGTASIDKPPPIRADLSKTVDLQTIDINPLGTLGTQETSETTQSQCQPAASPDNSQCITPANAAGYVAPEIVGNQTKVALIILLSTIIGLAVTILISYLLNNVMGKHDLDRISKEQKNSAKKFASKQITADYPQIIDSLAGLIAADNANAKSASLKRVLSDLELFGTEETSQHASKLLNQLGRATQPEIKTTAEQLSQSLKKDLGL